MKLTEIKKNPRNPRVIKNAQFKKLVNSIIEFPQMMKIRPMVYNEDSIVLGGNMRLESLKEIFRRGESMARRHLKEQIEKGKAYDIEKNIEELRPLFDGEIPEGWARSVDGLTPEEQQRFIIADNGEYGEWDFELLANDWDFNDLANWGVTNLPDIDLEQEEIDKKYNDQNAEYPLIPEYDESYDAIVVICETKTEIAALRTRFGIPEKAQSYKNSFLGKTNVIRAKDIL